MKATKLKLSLTLQKNCHTTIHITQENDITPNVNTTQPHYRRLQNPKKTQKTQQTQDTIINLETQQKTIKRTK